MVEGCSTLWDYQLKIGRKKLTEERKLNTTSFLAGQKKMIKNIAHNVLGLGFYAPLNKTIQQYCPF